MLDDRGEALDPVARIEIVDRPHVFIFRSVDVATDDAVAFPVTGELLKVDGMAADDTIPGQIPDL